MRAARREWLASPGRLGMARKRTTIHQSPEGDKADYAIDLRLWLISRPRT
jgi:hypothetical protein